MAVLKALPPAVSGLLRNPILIVVTALYGVVQLPQLLLQGSDPLVAAAVSLAFTGLFVFVIPFFQGGLLAMGDEAIAGETGLGTLIRAGKANYVSLLLAYLVLFALNFVFGIVVFVGALIGGVGVFLGGGDPSLSALAVVVGIGALVALAYLLLVFFVQFYAHAIVLSGTGLADGFRRSARLVRRNWVSVVGYTVLLVIGGAFFGLLGAGATALFTEESLFGWALPAASTPLLVGAAIVLVLSTGIMGALYGTYSVSFYREIEGEAESAPRGERL
jgi:hypothetical protein